MITVALLVEWNACWFSDDDAGARIAQVALGRTSMSPREIAALESIPLDDRLWVLCRALWYRDEAASHTFAIDSAALVSHQAGRAEDQAEHARLLVDLRRICALPAYRRAAELQRWAAAMDAAMDAARAAAWNPAWGAAWSAARAAAWDAAWDAAMGAAWAAAMRKAIDRALVALGPDADGWADPDPDPRRRADEVALADLSGAVR